MEALSTTGQECYCSAVTVSSSTQTCNVPQALPAPRPPHQTHSHTQSRCQPILSLPAATNRNWPSATDDAQKPLGKTPSGAGQTQPPLLQYRTNDSAQGTPPPSAAVKAVLSQDLTAEHTAGMTLYSMWPLSLFRTSSTYKHGLLAPQSIQNGTCPLKRGMQNNGYF